jgi:hypothetical protein
MAVAFTGRRSRSFEAFVRSGLGNKWAPKQRSRRLLTGAPGLLRPPGGRLDRIAAPTRHAAKALQTARRNF